MPAEWSSLPFTKSSEEPPYRVNSSDAWVAHVGLAGRVEHGALVEHRWLGAREQLVPAAAAQSTVHPALIQLSRRTERRCHGTAHQHRVPRRERSRAIAHVLPGRPGFAHHAQGRRRHHLLPNTGTCLELFPYEELANDVADDFLVERAKFSGITLAHNVRTKAEVDQILQRAKAAGATIEKPAQDTAWGGYSGYFSDPDGYVWEVAYGAFAFHDDGSLIIT